MDESFDEDLSHWVIDLKGKEINGYILLSILGKGVYGSVYRAVHLETKEEVAIKVISLKNVSSYEKEKKVLNYLRCEKYVVCYFESFEDEEYGYIVMEYLKNYISFPSFILLDIDYATKQKVVKEMIKAMEYIHSRDVTHGDLNANNIMIDASTLKVKYIDFGNGHIDKDKAFAGDYKNLADAIYVLIYGELRELLYYTKPDKIAEADAKVNDFIDKIPDILIPFYERDLYLIPDLVMMREEGLPGVYYSK